MSSAQSTQEEELNALTYRIIGCAMLVHAKLGPGLLESAYKECLFYESINDGMLVEKEKPMPLIYDGLQLDVGYRVDLLYEQKVIVEIKSVDTLNDIHKAQLLTYLKLSGCKIGLLINFNVRSLKEGIKRLAY